MAYIPPSGSVVAFQSNPSVLQATVGLSSTNASVITVGSPVANQSVSGTVQAQLLSTNASVITVGTAAPNQSVSGTVQTDVRGSVATVIIGGSILTTTGNSSVQVLNFPANQSVSGAVSVSNFPTTQNVSGSVAAWLQSTNASVITVGTAAANQSVSGTVQTDVRGSVATVIIGGSILTTTGNSSVQVLNFPANQSVSGAVSVSNFPTTQNVSGSVVATQGTTPWVTVGSVYQGVGWSGSVAAFQAGTQITSLVSTIPSSVQVGVSVMGIAPVTLTANTIPATASILVGVTANTNGSVLTTTGYTTAMLQITSGPGASITGALNFEGTVDGTQFYPIQGYNRATNAISSMATTESNWVFDVTGLQGMRARVSNWSVGSITARAVVSPADARPFATTGSVTTIQIGTWSASVMTNVITSIATAGQVMGSVAALQGTNPWNVAGSVAAFNISTNASFISVSKDSSIISVPSSSTITLFSKSPSIVGTYAEDAAHTAADKGLFVLGVRNDAVSSISGADRDYSPIAVDEASRVITSPFAGPKACIISYVGSTVSGSVQLIKASVIGSKSYITDFWLSNTGATTTLVTFQGGDTSVLGQFIAPTGGGNTSPGIAIPLQTTLSQDLAFKVAPSTSVLYVVVKGYQAP